MSNFLSDLVYAQKQRSNRQKSLKCSPAINAITIAKLHAARMSATAVKQKIAPIQDAFEKARKGKMTEAGWYRLCTALNFGQAIEAGGVVRGLSEHLDAAHDVLDDISSRAESTGKWVSPTLWASEITVLQELVRLYKYQLSQLSYGEFKAAVELATSRVRSAGGQVVNTNGMD